MSDIEKAADRIVSDLAFTAPEEQPWKLKLRLVEAMEEVRDAASGMKPDLAAAIKAWRSLSDVQRNEIERGLTCDGEEEMVALNLLRAAVLP